MILIIMMVRVEGLEPPRLAAPEPKSGASTNFATPAHTHLWADVAYQSRVAYARGNRKRHPQKIRDIHAGLT